MTSSVQFDTKGNLRHFLTIEGLSRQALVEILDAAESFISIGERQIRKVPILRGRTLVNLFLKTALGPERRLKLPPNDSPPT